jgi:pimeloyl-ACP methyl ester carboxylesterase
MPEPPVEFGVDAGSGVRLSGEMRGEGIPIVLLHGLSATRRYVVMGSRVLERSGHRTIAYDARGHGHSSPARTPEAYTYELLVEDLAAVLDALELERVALAGASMGAQTALRFAWRHPERVMALGLITPAFDPQTPVRADAYAGWERLARGLREGGVEGFVAANELDSLPAAWRETVVKAMRQRLSSHDHPLAVADALEALPRSRPFESWRELAEIEIPTVVVASRSRWGNATPLRSVARDSWSSSRRARQSPGRGADSPSCSSS